MDFLLRLRHSGAADKIEKIAVSAAEGGGKREEEPDGVGEVQGDEVEVEDIKN